MIKIKYLQEELKEDKQFVIHVHDARHTNQHFDLRMIHPFDEKILLSFAFGKDFDKSFNKKIAGVRTKDHDPRWLTLKSYRLQEFDKGFVKYLTFSKTFLSLDFNGEKIKGKYKLFKVRSNYRDDRWLLVKDKNTLQEMYNEISKTNYKVII